MTADDGATSSRGKRQAVSTSEPILELVADPAAHLAGPDAHTNEAKSYVANVGGASGATAKRKLLGLLLRSKFVVYLLYFLLY